ncbi:hypothetical protein N7454_005228 [Penicillium verhagenii]|nr:hypothetical protein N7454_005228 [Penicillium verhagenii]
MLLQLKELARLRNRSFATRNRTCDRPGTFVRGLGSEEGSSGGGGADGDAQSHEQVSDLSTQQGTTESEVKQGTGMNEEEMGDSSTSRLPSVTGNPDVPMPSIESNRTPETPNHALATPVYSPENSYP